MKQHLMILLVASLSVFAIEGYCAERSVADQPPNVVILYADGMGVADVSYGDPNANGCFRLILRMPSRFMMPFTMKKDWYVSTHRAG